MVGSATTTKDPHPAKCDGACRPRRGLSRRQPGGKRDMSRDGFWSRLLRGTRRVQARPDWEQLLGHDWADRVMTIPVTDRYHAKQGRSTGRLIVQQAEGRLAVYLKRHHR